MGRHNNDKQPDSWDENATPEDKADNFDLVDEALTSYKKPSNTPALDSYKNHNTGWKKD